MTTITSFRNIGQTAPSGVVRIGDPVDVRVPFGDTPTVHIGDHITEPNGYTFARVEDVRVTDDAYVLTVRSLYRRCDY